MNAQGGMSVANHFVVKFEGVKEDVFEFLCDEAQLPNMQAANGTIEGRYVGEGQVNYPHTRVFTELQLGFQCDANMLPLKYLNNWYGKIFNELPVNTASNYEGIKTTPLSHNRTNYLTYPESYCKTISITKTEIGPDKPRHSVTYLLERAWPFAVDAVPLQFGSAQLTKVTAQFYYSRHTIIHNDITKSV